MAEYDFFEKGNLKENYNEKSLYKRLSTENIKTIYDNIKKISGDFQKDKYLEISNKCTLSYKVLLDEFANGAFISDDAFESMLTLYYSKLDKKELEVYHYKFEANRLSKVKLEESFDLIFSIFGLSFKDIFDLMQQFISFLKVDGSFAILIPAYWYIKDNQTEIENKIIEYSKQNDKKWLFVEPLDQLASENGCSLIDIKELPISLNINRFELAYISSLEKLYKAILNDNTAHLEITNIPESNIELRTALVVFKKEKKTLTKDNLFNL